MLGNKEFYVILEGDCKHTWMSGSYETEPGYYICSYIRKEYDLTEVYFKSRHSEIILLKHS